jgi:hypothetical protein
MTIATVLKSRGRWLIKVLPRRVRPHHGVENREERTHARGERELLRLAGCDQAAIEIANDPVASGCDECPHVERGADGRPPTPHDPLAAKCSTVSGQWRDAHQRGDLLPVQVPAPARRRAACGSSRGPRPAQCAADSFSRARPGAVNRAVEIAIDPRDSPLEPAPGFGGSAPPRAPADAAPQSACPGARRRRVISASSSWRMDSASGRGVGRTRSANCAKVSASKRSILASWPVAFAKSRTCRGFVTTRGSSAAASAATSARSRPQSPSATMRVGAVLRSRATSM